MSLQPPPARREEERVVYAGVAPPGWDPKLPRQSANSKERLLDPPVAVSDPYGWMRDETRKKEEVLNHLKAENEYMEAMMKDMEGLRETLYQELLSSIRETDYQTPRPKGDYFFYSRSYEGKSYSTYCRAPRSATLNIEWDGSAEAPILPGEEVTLDVNELAKDQSHCSLGALSYSPSQKLLAYTVDYSGGEKYQLYVKDLESNTIVFHMPEEILSGSVMWGNDDSTLFYKTLDSIQRPYRVYRKKLHSDTQDELLFEDLDETHWVGSYKSLDQKYMFIMSSTKDTTEMSFLDLTIPESTLQCIAPRREKVRYNVDHRDGYWWISTNVGGSPNMKLMTCKAMANSQDEWKELMQPDEPNKPCFSGGYERSLDGCDTFANHIVACGREGGIPRVWILTMGGAEPSSVSRMEMLTFPETAHDVGLGLNQEYDVDSIAITYDSLVTPPSSILVNLNDTSQRSILKEKFVQGYVKDNYACERVVVKSRDGKTDIPTSLVYRKDVMELHQKTQTPLPTELYGYGSYGICLEADFSISRLPLLNRGMVYVIAHIRGGGEMGLTWYEEPDGAKFLCKKNTFNDFVDVARWLVEERKLTSPDLLACSGGSAGGMLIGSSINQAPELFKAAVLKVPFLDVLCTVIDSSIPLSSAEWEEWGNPNEEKYFQYIKEYCPMQTVAAGKKYPSILMTNGLNDPRVPYWEASKYAATLRHLQDPSSGPVLVKIDMTSGHAGASDRYQYFKDLAFVQAFVLNQLGLNVIHFKGN